jgi:hypothetical protein
MDRVAVDNLVADIMVEHFKRLRAVLEEEIERQVERRVGAKPVPPFVPPPIWTVGRHGAGIVVRHRNGLFMARRDTESEPPDEAWLPVLVGVAGLDIRFQSDREVALRAALSDGTQYEMVRNIAIPIVRGYWDAETNYDTGDRVFRHGEFHALKASRGVEPGGPGSDEVWLKVGGKNTKLGARAFALTDDGDLTESGHVIGSFKPLIRDLLEELVGRFATREVEHGH